MSGSLRSISTGLFSAFQFLASSSVSSRHMHCLSGNQTKLGRNKTAVVYERRNSIMTSPFKRTNKPHFGPSASNAEAKLQ